MKAVKNSLTSLLLLFSASCLASTNDGDSIYYYGKSTMTPTGISLDILDKITFTDNSIHMHKKNGTVTIPYEDFHLFTFRDLGNLTGVELVLTSDEMHIRYNAGSKTLDIESEKPLSGVWIYNMQGHIVKATTKTALNYHLTLDAAPKGVYLIKTMCNGKTIVNKIVL